MPLIQLKRRMARRMSGGGQSALPNAWRSEFIQLKRRMASAGSTRRMSGGDGDKQLLAALPNAWRSEFKRADRLGDFQ
jgi:hypothetical protein